MYYMVNVPQGLVTRRGDLRERILVSTRLRRFVLAKIRIHFFPAWRRKRDVKILNIKANIFFKSKNTLFDSYIIRFWYMYPRGHIFSGTKCRRKETFEEYTRFIRLTQKVFRYVIRVTGYMYLIRVTSPRVLSWCTASHFLAYCTGPHGPAIQI
jgi:hypothetical protein